MKYFPDCLRLSQFLSIFNFYFYLRPALDPYYDKEKEAKDKKTEEDAKKAKQQHAYIKRVIVHPSFHNISFKEAEKLMANLDQGECIVRPSSKVTQSLFFLCLVSSIVYRN